METIDEEKPLMGWLIFGVWVAWIIWAAVQTWRENNRGYDEWLPDDDERRTPNWRRI